MTTTVRIEAHCSPETEVHVTIEDNGNPVESFHMKDGATVEKYVYDERVIRVKEVPKKIYL